MGNPPTLADVARACAVSVATASKALSPHLDRCDLHPDTRARVIAKAREMGWSRNRPRSARARRRWHNIGILWGHRIPSFGVYEFVPEALAGILGDSFRLLVTPVPRLSDWRELQISLRLDGAVVLGHVDDQILADLEASDYPAVLINQESGRKLHQILVDDFAGTAELVSHLADLGHRRIVFVRNSWPIMHYSERERLRAVQDVAAARGVAVDDVRGRAYARAVDRCRAGATAVVCNSYWDVTGMLTALREAGLAVPHDVSLGVCHDLSWFAHLDPPVTGVQVPTREMAEIGARMLLELIAGRDISVQRRVLPESLAVRGSTARPRLAKTASRKHRSGRMT